MRISDWSSDVCSSDLILEGDVHVAARHDHVLRAGDRLVFIGATEAVQELRNVPGLRPATDQLLKVDDAGGERKLRSDERRVGEEGVRPSRYRWSPHH